MELVTEKKATVTVLILFLLKIAEIIKRAGIIRLRAISIVQGLPRSRESIGCSKLKI